MSSNYITALNDIFIGLEFQNTTQNRTQCISAINHYKFYQFLLIPAAIIIIIFAMMEKRKHFMLSLFGGRLGCVYPMDALTRSSRISYACAFGATVSLLYRIIFDQQFAIDYQGPLYLKTLVSIVSVVVYGVDFYPIFACLTVGSMFSYGVGSLYVWMFTVIEFYKFFECDVKLETRLVLLARDIPNLACWMYLSVSVPGRFILAAKKRSFFQETSGDFDHEQSLQEIRNSYQGHAVMKLLVRPDPPPTFLHQQFTEGNMCNTTFQQRVGSAVDRHNHWTQKQCNQEVQICRRATRDGEQNPKPRKKRNHEGTWTTTSTTITCVVGSMEITVNVKVTKISPKGIFGTMKNILKAILHDWLYHWKKDFLYSARILSIMIVSLQILYIATFEVISTLYPFLNIFLEGILLTVEPMGWYPEEGEPEVITTTRNTLYVTYYVLFALQVCIVVSASLAFLLGVVLILHMLSSYRRNLQALYRGDNSHIPPLPERSNASHMVGFLRYAGYQVGYIAWAYVIQGIILFLLTFGLATVITLIKEGYTDWLVNRVLQLWPVLVISLLLNIIQLLVAKFCFIQNRGDIMAMDNRRALFVFSFFMFFFNVFLGFISCLLRILKSIIIGALFLGRLDHSTLTRRFQFFDPGFAAYVGFLHVENAHTHPCVLVFVRLMVLGFEKRQHYLTVEVGGKSNSFKDDIKMLERKRMGARFNWYIAYSLLNNPSLRMYRKGFLQSLNKDLKEGKRRQISDKLSDDIQAIDEKQKGQRVDEIRQEVAETRVW